MTCTKRTIVKVSLIGSILATTACAELGGRNMNYFAPVVYEKSMSLESTDKKQTQTSRLEASDDDGGSSSRTSSSTNVKSAPSETKSDPVQVASKTAPDRFSGGAGGGTSGNSQMGGIGGGGSDMGSPSSGTSTIASTANNVAKAAADASKKVASTAKNTANKAVSAVKNIKITNPFK